MNSDGEMQTKSNIPRKINLINNLIWSVKLWEQSTALPNSAFSDVIPWREPVLVRFAAWFCRSRCWLSVPAVICNMDATEFIVATHETLASVKALWERKRKPITKQSKCLNSHKRREVPFTAMQHQHHLDTHLSLDQVPFPRIRPLFSLSLNHEGSPTAPLPQQMGLFVLHQPFKVHGSLAFLPTEVPRGGGHILRTCPSHVKLLLLAMVFTTSHHAFSGVSYQ